MKKAIVTGSEGFIGKALCERLKAEGVEVIGLDLKNGCDLSDPAFANDIRNMGADTIFHLAGCSDAYQNPAECFRNNLLCAVNILAAIQGTDIRLIFASTYLDDGGVYAESKRSAEKMIELYVKRYGVTACIVRCCNVYGPGDFNRQRVIPSMITKMLKGEPVTVNRALRDFSYIDDVVSAYIVIAKIPAQSLPKKASIVGTGRLMPLSELYDDLLGIIRSEYNLSIRDGGETQFCSFSYIEELSTLEITTLGYGLLKTVEWWKKQL